MFRAAVLTQLNTPLVITELDFHDELSCGQVLVEVHCSGICGAQLGEISGAKGPDRYLPHLLGHEGGGIVKRIGPGVIHVKVGDHVVMHWRKGLGIETAPPKYIDTKGNIIGGGWVTTFTEYAIVSENRLTPIGKDIPFEIAALMGCAITTALGMINNEAKLKLGQSIAIVGCGGVGLSVIQGAEMVSANPIIAIDVCDSKLNDLARPLGASHLVNYKNGMIESVHNIVGKRGVDVFVDCTGNISLIDEGLQLTAPGGRLILVGQPTYKKDVVLHEFRQHYCGKTMMDSQGGLTNPSVDIPRYLELYKIGKLELDKLITHRFPLENVNDAIELMKCGTIGRCVLVMNQ